LENREKLTLKEESISLQDILSRGAVNIVGQEQEEEEEENIFQQVYAVSLGRGGKPVSYLFPT